MFALYWKRTQFGLFIAILVFFSYFSNANHELTFDYIVENIHSIRSDRLELGLYNARGEGLGDTVEIGAGEFGTVFRVNLPNLMPVALKHFNVNDADPEHELAQYTQLSAIFGPYALSSRAIHKVYEVCEIEEGLDDVIETIHNQGFLLSQLHDADLGRFNFANYSKPNQTLIADGIKQSLNGIIDILSKTQLPIRDLEPKNLFIGVDSSFNVNLVVGDPLIGQAVEDFGKSDDLTNVQAFLRDLSSAPFKITVDPKTSLIESIIPHNPRCN